MSTTTLTDPDVGRKIAERDFGWVDPGTPVVPRAEAGSDRLALLRVRLLSALRRAGVMLLTVVPVAFISTSICYGLLYLSPVNAAAEILGQDGGNEAVMRAEIHRLAIQLGSNKPYLAQYFTWLWRALHGNLGNSYITRLPVGTSIMQRLPVDLTICALALVLAVVIGFGAGIAAAWRRGGVLDRVVTALSAVAQTIPEFWLGILLIIAFAVHVHVFPALGYVSPTVSVAGWFSHALLPAVSLALVVAAGVARQVRTSLVGVLAENYIVGATVRGLGRRSILFRHALRNAAGPAVSVIGMAIPALIGGAIIVEQVFGLPGIGQFALQGAQDKDMPVIQGVLLILIALVLASNILVNLALGWLRPETKQ